VLMKDKKSKIIADHRVQPKDTGSAEVQVAILSERITQLSQHMTAFKNDSHAPTGMQKLVGQRKKLLAYLKREDASRYEKLIQKLGLRK
jgi:small subunit ribosomal protein S15